VHDKVELVRDLGMEVVRHAPGLRAFPAQASEDILRSSIGCSTTCGSHGSALEIKATTTSSRSA
jgi:hypothetical protein